MTIKDTVNQLGNAGNINSFDEYITAVSDGATQETEEKVDELRQEVNVQIEELRTEVSQLRELVNGASSRITDLENRPPPSPPTSNPTGTPTPTPTPDEGSGGTGGGNGNTPNKIILTTTVPFIVGTPPNTTTPGTVQIVSPNINSGESVSVGDTVTVRATPIDGYQLDNIEIYGSDSVTSLGTRIGQTGNNTISRTIDDTYDVWIFQATFSEAQSGGQEPPTENSQLVITTNSLGPAQVRRDFNIDGRSRNEINVVGGVPPYRYRLTENPLGVFITPNGVINGFVSVSIPGDYDTTVQVTDSQNNTVSKTFTINVLNSQGRE